MKVVLLGAPGAGKGTLANNVKEKTGLLHISTGDILREEMKNNTPLGQEAKSYVESGGLVPDEVVTKLVENKFAHDSRTDKGFLLDGFPRTRTQAEDLDKILNKLNKPLDLAIYLEASLPVIIQRLTGRRVCKKCGALFHVANFPPKQEGICDQCGGQLYQRADDNEETIKKRMDVYLENTKPIIAFYEQQNKLKKINADLDSQEVLTAAMQTIK